MPELYGAVMQRLLEIRKSPIGSRCTELTFADRYSFGILNPMKIADDSEEEVKRLAEQFYNDTYLMDQNACSTPHLFCGSQIKVVKQKRERKDSGVRYTKKQVSMTLQISKSVTSML